MSFLFTSGNNRSSRFSDIRNHMDPHSADPFNRSSRSTSPYARTTGSPMPVTTNLAAEIAAGIKVYGVAPGMFLVQTRGEQDPMGPLATTGQMQDDATPKVKLPRSASDEGELVQQGQDLEKKGVAVHASPGEMSKERTASRQTCRQRGSNDCNPPIRPIHGAGLLQSKYSPTAQEETPKPVYTISRPSPQSNATKSQPPVPAPATPTASTKLTPTTTHRLLPPSGVEPDESKKRYCAYWMRTGECDFSQQGCRFKHEMPEDRATLQALGFRTVPRWYLEKMQGKTWIGTQDPDCVGGKDIKGIGRGKGVGEMKGVLGREQLGSACGGAGARSNARSAPNVAVNSRPTIPISKPVTHTSRPQTKGKSISPKSPGHWFQDRAAAEKAEERSTATVVTKVSAAPSGVAKDATKLEISPSKGESMLAESEDLIDFDFPALTPARVECSPSTVSSISTTTTTVNQPDGPSTASTSSNTSTQTPASSSASSPTTSLRPTTPPKPNHPVHFANKTPSPPTPHRLALELRHAQMAAQMEARALAATGRAAAKLAMKTEEKARVVQRERLSQNLPTRARAALGAAVGGGGVMEKVMAFESKGVDAPPFVVKAFSCSDVRLQQHSQNSETHDAGTVMAPTEMEIKAAAKLNSRSAQLQGVIVGSGSGEGVGASMWAAEGKLDTLLSPALLSPKRQGRKGRRRGIRS